MLVIYISMVYSNLILVVVRDTSRECRCLEFSPLGDRLAWHNGRELKIYDTVNDKVMHTIDIPSLTYLLFSPKSTTLATWQVYSVGKHRHISCVFLWLLCLVQV